MKTQEPLQNKSSRLSIDRLKRRHLAEISDACRFRDYLFDRNMSSSLAFETRRQLDKTSLLTNRSAIKLCHHQFRDKSDDMRWLIALVSDTGMRLGEAAGLLKADIKINDSIPHIDLKPHSWRNLKTKGSQSVPDRCVIHSFRHSLRDRLRAVECPADIIDAIGGWTAEGVGHQYGKGHSLSTEYMWISEF